jgi:hypothetical protein
MVAGAKTIVRPFPLPSNGEVEGPPRSAPERRGRTISQRPRRQAASASRTPPTIVSSHWHLAGSRSKAYKVKGRHHKWDKPQDDEDAEF